jgi:hypothetical protein
MLVRSDSPRRRTSVDPLARLAATYSLGSFLHLCHSAGTKEAENGCCGVMAMRPKAANSVRIRRIGIETA